jgi:hypothetical protein
VAAFVAAAEHAAQGADPELVSEMAQKPRTTKKARWQKAGGKVAQAPLTQATVLQGPTYSPFQRAASTFFLAFVQYGR